jgi:hypothetical protein
MTSSTTPHTVEQLTLLPEPAVPLRFRLDDATRRRGLRHIAEIRARLAQPSRLASVADVERPAA